LTTFITTFFFPASLALHSEAQNLPQYAGMCWQTLARCESEVGHSNEETAALLRAGKQYFQAESNEAVFGCSSLGEEHFQVCRGALNNTCFFLFCLTSFLNASL